MQKKKIKILFLSHSPFANGAELALFNLVINLDRNIFETHVVFPYNGPLVDMFRSHEIDTHISPLERWIRFEYDKPIKGSTLIARVESLIGLIKDLEIDLIHTNTSVIIEGALAATIAKKPHIWHCHEFLEDHPELSGVYPLSYVYSCMKILSACIVSVSEFVRSQFAGPANDSLTIYNGISSVINVPIEDYFRKVYRLKKEDVIIINVGVLSETKGYKNFLNVSRYAVCRNKNLKFFWIGGAISDSLSVFEDFVKSNKLEDFVFYLGHRIDVRSLIQCSDILICTSLIETFSLTILEAMSAQKPVISTDCGGPAEIIIEGVTGYLVPVNDYLEMSECVLKLSNDLDKRNVFGLQGLKLFNQKFSLNRFVHNFEKLYINHIETLFDTKKEKEKLDIVNEILSEYEDLSRKHWKNLKQTKISAFINRIKSKI